MEGVAMESLVSPGAVVANIFMEHMEEEVITTRLVHAYILCWWCVCNCAWRRKQRTQMEYYLIWTVSIQRFSSPWSEAEDTHYTDKDSVGNERKYHLQRVLTENGYPKAVVRKSLDKRSIGRDRGWDHQKTNHSWWLATAIRRLFHRKDRTTNNLRRKEQRLYACRYARFDNSVVAEHAWKNENYYDWTWRMLKFCM